MTTDPPKRPPGDGVQSVGRAFDILEAIADHGGELGISQLGAATGLPYATIHRLVTTLTVRDYLRQDTRSRKYELGPRLLRLGSSARARVDALLRPCLREIADLTGETTNLGVLEEGQVVYVGQVPSRHVLRTFTQVGNRVFAHSTAVGKAILAYEDRAAAERIIDEFGLPERTPNTITDAEALFAELDAIQGQGYAIDDEEQEVGVRCLAVPVLLDGAPIAAVSISAPASRLPTERTSTLVEPMRDIVTRAADIIRTGKALSYRWLDQ